jgi:small subunit ribosomal protein S6
LLRDYELVYIIKPTVETEALGGLNERIQGWIGAGGGEVQKVNPWGRRRLAYQIEHFRDGTYVQVNFRAAPTALPELERQIKLSEDVLRYMLIRQGT